MQLAWQLRGTIKNLSWEVVCGLFVLSGDGEFLVYRLVLWLGRVDKM